MCTHSGVFSAEYNSGGMNEKLNELQLQLREDVDLRAGRTSCRSQ